MIFTKYISHNYIFQNNVSSVCYSYKRRFFFYFLYYSATKFPKLVNLQVACDQSNEKNITKFYHDFA